MPPMESHSLFLLAAVVFVAGLRGTAVLGASRPKMNSVLQQNDVSDVTWAHAVNSWSDLEKALAGSVDFLEADISLGHVTGSEEGPAIPIMAHPPDTSSDISLDTWLSTVVKRGPQKGLKLDFKSMEAVEPSLLILQKYAAKLNSTVWLNADVLAGPINSPVTPVAADQFLSLCQQYFSKATLSTGWTTEWYPTFSEDQWHYTWRQVREMADVIRCRKFDENDFPSFTFPVRGIFASRSTKQLKWLLSEIPESTLTVWTGKFDPLEIHDLLRIRSSFPFHRVYYDVPEKLNKLFKGKKTSVDVPGDHVITDDGKWIVINHGQAESCSSSTYANKNGIVFGRSATAAVLHRNVISSSSSDLRISGKLKFLDSYSGTELRPEKRVQELKIVLVDVSLFAKNDTGVVGTDIDPTSGDSEIIWSAINSSAIYTSRHQHESRDGSSCQIFKLDASQDKSFQVWTVHCDAMQEDDSFEELSRAGVPAISSRKRLVLPRGPFMLGFVSSGDGHVVIYDLVVDESTTPGVGASGVKTPLELFTTLLLSLFVFILS